MYWDSLYSIDPYITLPMSVGNLYKSVHCNHCHPMPSIVPALRLWNCIHLYDDVTVLYFSAFCASLSIQSRLIKYISSPALLLLSLIVSFKMLHVAIILCHHHHVVTVQAKIYKSRIHQCCCHHAKQIVY